MSAPASPAASYDLLVETSALVAILLEEPEWRSFVEKIVASRCCTTSVNIFEASLALSKQVDSTPSIAHSQLLRFTERLAIEVIPFTPEMLPHAVAARERYGRGRKGLNMGDCLSYAAAKQLGLKLLYKGDDFAATDVNE